jgi:two-component system, OmpR family, sensor histidine kinase YxdK
MKLFLRDQSGLFILIGCQFLITFILLKYRNDPNLDIFLYAMLLCSVMLLCYLTYRFIAMRSFYERLSNDLRSLDESTQSYGYSVLGSALTELLHSQYRSYQSLLLAYHQHQEHHLTFTNQWVHHMKTPLAVIDLMTQDEDDPRFDSIREEAERLQRGLNMVLYIARLEAFEKDFHVEPVRLLKAIHDVIQEHKRFFIRNNVYPEISVAQDIVVISDEKWLMFILEQLLTNAVKYSAGVSNKIYLSASIKKDQIELVVADRGIGIPPQDLPRIFEPYFTGENGRLHHGSTGMGLALVHDACQQLKHPIFVESEVGKGTIVHLTFVRYMSFLSPSA